MIRTPCIVLWLAVLVGCGELPLDSRSETAAAPSAIATGAPAPLLLISLDGFRHDYLSRADTPHLDRLVREGVAADGLIPVFPSKTFTNHWTIVTGLYAGSHGVVANNMWDPQTRQRFSGRDREAVSDPAWFGGEPIWRTAERQGLTAATLFWVGSEAPVGGSHPSYWQPYDGRMRHTARIDQVLAWLDLPVSDRPDFLTLYFSTVDSAGHRHGPETRQVDAAITHLDRDLGRLLRGLEERALLGALNIIIVSDHGMTEVAPERLIILDDFLPLNRVRVSDWGPATQIWANGMSVDDIMAALQEAHPRLRAWRRDEIPAHYRFRDHHRVPDVLAEADLGWMIESRAYVENNKRTRPRGMHGWDPRHRDMHGIFIAHGPAFPPGGRLPAVENIHIYALLAQLLGITPARHEGDVTRWLPILAAKHHPAGSLLPGNGD